MKTKQEAIDYLKLLEQNVLLGEKITEAVYMAISALQAQELSETQKELDTIYREAAINALIKEGTADGAYGYVDVATIEKIMRGLPPAQPENIRCYECKHGIHSGRGNVYICNVSPELVMEHTDDFYCKYAKRRTDD